MATTPGEGAPRALARFAIQAGPDAGREIPVARPVVTIGRGGPSDLVLDDDSVSTAHARLEYEHGGWRITDQDSTNGTYVEGVRLAPGVPTPLPYGATVRFGGVRLHFRPEEDADLESARADYVPPPPPSRVAERSGGFRVPVWAVLLVIALIGLAVFLFTRNEAEPVAEPAAVEGSALLLPSPPVPIPA